MTRWKGDKARELGGDCKLYYSGADERGRNGVGIVLSKELKDSLVSVSRTNDRAISVKVRHRRDSGQRYMHRREGHYVGRRVMEMKVQGRRKRGIPKRRWLDKAKDDIKEKGLSADEVCDRATWRRMSSCIVPK